MADSKTASLTVLGGPLAGTQCVLPDSGTLTIGSSPDSTLYLDLPAVSPYHARVVIEPGRITVHDTGSSRTVHLNDNAVDAEGTELRNGDILWLGAPGDDDVVMLQCILPKSPAVAPVPEALSSGATPTPEIETVALWAMKTDTSLDEALAHAAKAAAAEDLPEGAILEEESGDASEEPSEAPEPELVADAETSEPPAEEATPEPDADVPILEGAEEIAEVAPTLLMSSADEVSEAADPSYRETVRIDSAPQFTPEMFTAAEEPPAMDATSAIDQAPTLAETAATFDDSTATEESFDSEETLAAPR